MIASVPGYLSFIFVLVFLYPIYLIASLASRNVHSDQPKRLFLVIFLFYIIYLSGVSIATLNGAFQEITLPPKIIQFTTIPFLIFLLIVVSQTSTYKQFLHNVKLSELVRLHHFRLIGSFFIVLMLFGQLPKPFALIAGLGDITTALTSIWLARLIHKGKTLHKWVIAWNTFGLLDIFATSAMAILLTKLTIETGALGVDVLASFPFCFIPAFAPATIIFLHVSIYRKLFLEKK